jgi:hypothetical protein
MQINTVGGKYGKSSGTGSCFIVEAGSMQTVALLLDNIVSSWNPAGENPKEMLLQSRNDY